jgi:IS1 family transposase/transposase-like protein
VISFRADNQAHCPHERTKKCGTTKAGTQRYECLDCGKRFTQSTRQLDGMRIDLDKATLVLSMLVDCVNVEAITRITGVHKHTILDLLTLVGYRCQKFLFRKIMGLQVDDVQADETWQFIYCKRKNVERSLERGAAEAIGDSYTYTAIERRTKLILAWHFGRRTGADTLAFCSKLRHATRGHFQLSTDAFNGYMQAVPACFAGRIDYGQLVKTFGKSTQEDQRQYSPAKIIKCEKEVVMGSPDEDQICTSHSERSNGSIRNFTKRMGRLTYCFSKKWVNHEMALALYFAAYNFCKKHRSLKGKTPAMAAGLTDHVWTVRELLENVSTT